MTLAVNIAQSGSNNVTFRNRIINGGMVIDQRNAGASVTPTNGQYGLDRWAFNATAASKFTAQQNAGSVTPPVGFSKYLGTTSSSAYSVAAGDIFSIYQIVEGFNIADLAWGTANAATVTLSFWVRSSLTGTFGGSLVNGAGNRSYPFTYTISSANTWTSISVTIAGDTTGTWTTDNTSGVRLTFGLGVGSTYSGTAGSWSANGYYSATGAVSVVGTSGATFYITGVQLEAGTTASPFEYRQYGTELNLCYRYYYRIKPSGAGNPFQGAGIAYTTSKIRFAIPYPVTMRTAPTALEQSGTAGDYSQLQTSWVINSAVPAHDNTSTTATNVTFTSSAGFTTGYGAIARDETGNAYLGWSAEL